MWIHLLSLGLIDGASAATPPEPPVVTPSGGGGASGGGRHLRKLIDELFKAPEKKPISQITKDLHAEGPSSQQIRATIDQLRLARLEEEGNTASRITLVIQRLELQLAKAKAAQEEEEFIVVSLLLA